MESTPLKKQYELAAQSPEVKIALADISVNVHNVRAPQLNKAVVRMNSFLDNGVSVEKNTVQANEILSVSFWLGVLCALCVKFNCSFWVQTFFQKWSSSFFELTRKGE